MHVRNLLEASAHAPLRRSVPTKVNIAIYNLYMHSVGGGERRSALMAHHFARRHNVSLFVDIPVDIGSIVKNFDIDLSGVNIIPLQGKNHEREIAANTPDIFINNSHGSEIRCVAPAGIYMCMFPAGPTGEYLKTYNAITANSRYTAHWIKKRWGRDAEIVYSACRSMGPPSKKEKVIINVGRFSIDFPGNHHKRQNVLATAFRNMKREIDEGWQLHLIGNVADGPGHTDFLRELINECKGYPIRILTGLPIRELRDEYRKASAYWHATGYGSSEEEHPQKQEHFGISIIEAMSAGAVPIVYDGGGPREFVDSGSNGFLWENTGELIQVTTHLAHSPWRRKLMSHRAIRRSKAFTADQFLARMEGLVEDLIARTNTP
jgi:glycosyltransferase involved in cell wall biosynthesis